MAKIKVTSRDSESKAKIINYKQVTIAAFYS